MKGYAKWFPASIWLAVVALLATGLLLAPTTLDLRMELDMPWRLPGAGRMAVAAFHAFLSLILVGIFGALWIIHVRAGWRQHRHRGSGSLLVATLLLLAVTGVCIYYLGEQRTAAFASAVHLVIGLVFAVAFFHHGIIGRRSIRNAPHPLHHLASAAQRGLALTEYQYLRLELVASEMGPRLVEQVERKGG